MGGHYTARFLKRYPEVATTVTRATDRNMVLAINKESLKTHFNNLERCISHNKILPRICRILMKRDSEWGRGESRMSWELHGYEPNHHGEHRMAIESG